MYDRKKYRKATKKDIGMGGAICNVGYICPYGDENHYHCGTCGGRTGMFGHITQLDDGTWKVVCPEDMRE